MIIISGTGAELDNRTEPWVDAKGEPITFIPENRKEFPRIENGHVTNCRTLAGLFYFENSRSKVLLEVLPKGWGRPDKNSGSMDRWIRFLSLLHEQKLLGQDLDELCTGDASNALASGPREYQNVIEFFLDHTFRALEEAVKKGTPPIANITEDISPRFRGKVNWNKQTAKFGGLQHKFCTEHLELNWETKLYAFLFAAFQKLSSSNRKILVSPDVRSRVRRLTRALDHLPTTKNVSSLRPFVEDYIRNKPRKYAHFYRAVRLLAKWVYGIPLSASDCLSVGVEGVQLELDRVFEKWCRKSIGEALERLGIKNIRSSENEEQWCWGHYNKKEIGAKLDRPHGKLLKPDILLFRERQEGQPREILVIADAKYKDFSSLESFDSEDESKLGRNDFFQVFCYKKAVENGSFVNRHRPDKQITVPSKEFGPRLLIFYPTEDVELDSTGFFGESKNDWSLRVVGLPFNKFISGGVWKDQFDSFVRYLAGEMNLPMKKAA